jgi:hypothetical protein
MRRLRPFGTASSGGRLDDFGGHEVAVSLNLDPWWDEPEYSAAMGSFTTRGSFILRKLRDRDPVRYKEVMDDLYRDDAPDPQDITKFQWQTILAYMGASEEEIRDVQKRMGRLIPFPI